MVNFGHGIFTLVVIIWSISECSGRGYENFLDVAMPGYSPERDEQYVCVAVEVPQKSGYIVEFLPSATADRTHHMLAYGCSEPAHKVGEAWDCEHAMMCNGGQKIIYAWARNAPPLTLPQGVGVPIGADYGLKYVVLQMHYAKKFGGQVYDYSGVRLRIDLQQPQYLAGIYLLMPGGGPIPANTETYFMNATCEYKLSPDVHPFAFRPHTHHLGRVVSAYKYSPDGKWSKIGKGNPQWPQRFYPIEEKVTIQTGDRLAAQCLYDSTGRDMDTSLGSHGHDEMCNFYMYYYVNASEKGILNEFEGCGGGETDELFKNYPTEAMTRFPPNPDMEETAKTSEMSFSVTEKLAWPTSDIKFGQIGSLALDNKGNIVVFHRGDRVWGNGTFSFDNKFMEKDKGAIAVDTVIVVSEDGAVISTWGKNFFYMPHGVYMDDHDYIWLTDVAMHQVFKFDMKQSTMKPLLTLGKAFEPGSDEHHFCKPSAVAVAAEEGTIFVADGYCNNRIMSFGSDGRYFQSYGEATLTPSPKSSPSLTSFSLPHAMSLDDGRRRIFVADRQNGRIVFFTFDGTPLGQLAYNEFGDTVYSVSYCPAYDTIFVLNGPGYTGKPDDLRVFAFDGSTKRLMYSWKPNNGQFGYPHAVLTSRNCSRIYVGEIGPNKLWRFDILSSGRRASTIEYTDTSTGTGTTTVVTSGKKPNTASDNESLGSKFRLEAENTLRLMVILFIAIAVPIVLIILVCCCIQCRKKKGVLRGRDLFDTNYGTKSLKGSLFNGRDHKGFKPLSTEDIDGSDASDDSDAEHTLYLARNFGTRKA